MHVQCSLKGISDLFMYARFLVGPPVAGALYDRFGFHGPFIFGIIVTAVDLIGRFLIIERKHAIQWGVDPAAPTPQRADPEGDAVEVSVEPKRTSGEQVRASVEVSAPGEAQKTEGAPTVDSAAANAVDAGSPPPGPSQATANEAALATPSAQVHISLWAVLVKLVRSIRADTVFLRTLFYGYARLYRSPPLSSRIGCPGGSSRVRSRHSRSICRMSGTSTPPKLGCCTLLPSCLRSSVRLRPRIRSHVASI